MFLRLIALAPSQTVTIIAGFGGFLYAGMGVIPILSAEGEATRCLKAIAPLTELNHERHSSITSIRNL